MPVERARALNDRLEGEASALGLTWSMKDARPTNTFDAHRLIALASSQGKSAAMSERLFRAYFSDGLLVSDHQILPAWRTKLESRMWHHSGRAISTPAKFEVTRPRPWSWVSPGASLLIDGKFMVVGAQERNTYSTLSREPGRAGDGLVVFAAPLRPSPQNVPRRGS